MQDLPARGRHFSAVIHTESLLRAACGGIQNYGTRVLNNTRLLSNLAFSYTPQRGVHTNIPRSSARGSRLLWWERGACGTFLCRGRHLLCGPQMAVPPPALRPGSAGRRWEVRYPQRSAHPAPQTVKRAKIRWMVCTVLNLVNPEFYAGTYGSELCVAVRCLLPPVDGDNITSLPPRTAVSKRIRNSSGRGSLPLVLWDNQLL